MFCKTIILFITINVSLSSSEYLCNSIIVSNYIQHIHQLDNCTTIAGFLHLSLLLHTTAEDFENHQFPKLREVTGYILIYRVQGLQSLGRLFPNLQVIRGQTLLVNYALVVFEADHLKQLDLGNLVSIQRGSVRLEKNPQLCYIETVDWAAVTGKKEMAITQSLNGPEKHQLCTNCTCSKICPQNCTSGHCWGPEKCQKFQRNIAIVNTTHPMCHPLCLGGCRAPSDPSMCIVCKGFMKEGKCVDKCPPELVMDPIAFRCITAASCKTHFNRTGEIENGSCVQGCDPKSENAIQICDRCSSKCCDGAVVWSIGQAQALSGCRIINGSLEIRIPRIHPSVVEELEKYLCDIEEIYGSLIIRRSYIIKSLSFLRNLKVIHGLKPFVEDNLYSLIVYGNKNLEHLFDGSKKIEVRNGELHFHLNPQLCLNEIMSLKKYMKINKKFTAYDINKYSNGYNARCSAKVFASYTTVLKPTEVDITWSPPGNFANYIVYVTEAPEKNVKPFYGTYGCSKDDWITQIVKNKTIDNNYIRCKLENLKPFTQYAYFIRNFIPGSLPPYRYEVQSNLSYFQTFSDQPEPPVSVSTVAKNETSLTVQFSKPLQTNGILTHYIIYVFLLIEDNIDRDDICLNPIDYNDETQIFYEIQNEKPEECLCNLENLPCGNGTLQTGCLSTGKDHVINKRSVERKKQLKRENESRKDDTFYETIRNIAKNDPASGGRSKRSMMMNLGRNQSTVLYPTKVVNGYVYQKTINTSSTDTQYTVSDLRPFGLYSIQISACLMNEHGEEVCGPVEIYTDRLLSNDSADNIIDFNVEVMNKTIQISWEEPKYPNGFIYGYIVEYLKFGMVDFDHVRICISQENFTKSNHSYLADDMEPGEYLIRLRATSLAGHGNYTGYKWVNVTSDVVDVVDDLPYPSPLKNDSSWWIFVFLLIPIIALAIPTTSMAYKYYRSTLPGDRIPLVFNDEDDDDVGVSEPIAIDIYRNSDRFYVKYVNFMKKDDLD